MIDPRFITTTFNLEGYQVVANCGIVRGIVVRSRSAIGNFAAGIQQFFGGNISLYTELCEQARQEAFDIMRQHGTDAGGNAIVGMRYESNDVSAGATEVLCYGTAVVVALKSPPVPVQDEATPKPASEAGP
ncbi:MAG: YbjQ family protein [Planctomycetes bacterium]|nr:YbjQ family protein [Planctomycetota bacterium]